MVVAGEAIAGAAATAAAVATTTETASRRIVERPTIEGLRIDHPGFTP
jgi:hypothetical protein